MSPIVAELRAGAEARRLFASLEKMAISYLHMHANRLLRTAARQELVLYDLLASLYSAKLHRRIGR
jgi:hypothetical protein